MISKIYSAALRGVEAVEVEVEVAAREADGANAGRINIVGLPDAAVRESGDRVTTAILASALNFVYGVHTVNLAPADLKKEGPSFDLPIALAMIACEQEEELSQARDLMIVGELALDGTFTSGQRGALDCPRRESGWPETAPPARAKCPGGRDGFRPRGLWSEVSS